jgi:hypothetical protein
MVADMKLYLWLGFRGKPRHRKYSLAQRIAPYTMQPKIRRFHK